MEPVSHRLTSDGPCIRRSGNTAGATISGCGYRYAGRVLPVDAEWGGMRCRTGSEDPFRAFRHGQSRSSMPHSSAQVSPGSSHLRSVPELKASAGAVMGSTATATGCPG
jgi:hypothetical protein